MVMLNEYLSRVNFTILHVSIIYLAYATKGEQLKILIKKKSFYLKKIFVLHIVTIRFLCTIKNGFRSLKKNHIIMSINIVSVFTPVKIIVYLNEKESNEIKEIF